jgi:thioredoxin reductase
MTDAPSATIAIIGGGSAGMSCALWLKQLGFTPIIIEQAAQLGGQLLRLDRINRWVLGSPDKTSLELGKTYAQHIQSETITVKALANLFSITAQAQGFDLLIESDDLTENTTVRALVIATGVRVLGAENFAALPGFQSVNDAGLVAFDPIGHLADLPALVGTTVAVVGGGDNAHFTAKDLALAGAHVHLIVRSRAKAKPTIRREILALIETGQISEHNETQITAFKHYQDGIEMTAQQAGADMKQILAKKVFARLGFTPNTEFLGTFAAFQGMAMDAGYVLTDAAKRTSIPWVYAIGDVASRNHQSVVGAIASGAIAAQDLSERK